MVKDGLVFQGCHCECFNLNSLFHSLVMVQSLIAKAFTTFFTKFTAKSNNFDIFGQMINFNFTLSYKISRKRLLWFKNNFTS